MEYRLDYRLGQLLLPPTTVMGQKAFPSNVGALLITDDHMCGNLESGGGQRGNNYFNRLTFKVETSAAFKCCPRQVKTRIWWRIFSDNSQILKSKMCKVLNSYIFRSKVM